MPVRWNNWAHVTWTTKGSWLPGDPRSFRSCDHRIHSSGDYDNPPPANEHAGLYRYARRRCPDAIRLPADLFEPVGTALLAKFAEMNFAVRALAVLVTHVHTLIRVGCDDAKPIVGRCKQAASHRIGNRLPGSVWAEGCHVERIHDEHHYRRAVNYILEHRLEGGWVRDAKAHPDLRKASGPASGEVRHLAE